MNEVVEMELVSGGSVRLFLPKAGDFESFYVFSMEYSGYSQFWRLLERLMIAAGRPVYAFTTDPLQQGLKLHEITRAAMQELFQRHGYGFGIFFDVFRAGQDIFAENQKLLFLRDPRQVLLNSYRHLAGQAGTAPASFPEFLRSPAAGRLAAQYRRFAEFYRREPNVRLLRYEDAVGGWHEIAADVASILKLPIDSVAMAAIAFDTPPVGDLLLARSPLVRDTEIAKMESQLADVLATFGYAAVGRADQHSPRINSRSADTFTNAEALQMPGIYEPDPVLMVRLRPNSSTEMEVLGRRIIQNVDANGCRPVIGQPVIADKTLAVFGCSFTYGLAVAAEETFCSVMQTMFPTWRVENHGVPSYSQTRNLIQLELEARWKQPEFVTFCWISHHLTRNVADIDWIKLTSGYMLRPGEVPGQRFPRATLDANGTLQFESLHVPRKEFLGIDFSDFASDPHYLDQVCFRLFERAYSIVTGYGGHFFVTTLKGKFSAWMIGQLADAGIPMIDASLEGQQYTCWPNDGHPNALANRIYAERIRDYLLRHTASYSACEAVAESS